MSFASSVKGSVYLGGPGGILLTYGEWSGAVGDAAGTIVVGGAYPLGALFFSYEDDNQTQIFPRVSLSTSGSVTTFTIQNQDNITTGKFLIVTAGGS